MWNYSDWEWAFLPKEQPWPWSMDARHVKLLYQLMMTGLFVNVLEIGSYKGASTSGFIQALKDGANFTFTTCDVQITPSLKRVVRQLGRSKVRVEEKSSLDLISPAYDLIMVDGKHTLPHVSREFGLCLFHEIKTLFAHDTSSTHIPTCEGPPVMKKMLECHPAFSVITDDKQRPGEFTERGFTLATRDKRIFAACEKLFEQT